MRQDPFSAWIDCVKYDRAGLLATVLHVKDEGATGGRLFVSEDGQLCGSLGDDTLDRQVGELAEEKLRQLDPKSETRLFKWGDRSVTVFIDVHVPVAEVMIFGAGHDAIPVATFARKCGFRVTVIDQREAYATEARFPDTHIIRVRPEELATNVHPAQRTFIVIMNHHLEKDRMCLHFALQSVAPYVGLLGPVKRRNRLLASLHDQGVTFSQAALSRLYNPIGLDIGAEGPEEIAVSILSEIIAVKHERSGLPLRTQHKHPTVYEAVEHK